jgi:hypothetical protein
MRVHANKHLNCVRYECLNTRTQIHGNVPTTSVPRNVRYGVPNPSPCAHHPPIIVNPRKETYAPEPTKKVPPPTGSQVPNPAPFPTKRSRTPLSNDGDTRSLFLAPHEQYCNRDSDPAFMDFTCHCSSHSPQPTRSTPFSFSALLLLITLH